MIPIHELLQRIRWDREFGRGEFEIGYYDRVENAIIRVPVRDILFDKDHHGIFELAGADGTLHGIPLHRIREVYKDGELIWRRDRPV